jgi:hypothetical protein
MSDPAQQVQNSLSGGMRAANATMSPTGMADLLDHRDGTERGIRVQIAWESGETDLQTTESFHQSGE